MAQGEGRTSKRPCFVDNLPSPSLLFFFFSFSVGSARPGVRVSPCFLPFSVPFSVPPPLSDSHESDYLPLAFNFLHSPPAATRCFPFPTSDALSATARSPPVSLFLAWRCPPSFVLDSRPFPPCAYMPPQT